MKQYLSSVFFCYGKLLFCNVRNAPRGCALRRTRQMSQAIYVSLRPLLNKRHWRENDALAGDKAFEKSFVSLTGKYFLTRCNI